MRPAPDVVAGRLQPASADILVRPLHLPALYKTPLVTTDNVARCRLLTRTAYRIRQHSAHHMPCRAPSFMHRYYPTRYDMLQPAQRMPHRTPSGISGGATDHLTPRTVRRYAAAERRWLRPTVVTRMKLNAGWYSSCRLPQPVRRMGYLRTRQITTRCSGDTFCCLCAPATVNADGAPSPTLPHRWKIIYTGV